LYWHYSPGLANSQAISDNRLSYNQSALSEEHQQPVAQLAVLYNKPARVIVTCCGR